LYVLSALRAYPLERYRQQRPGYASNLYYSASAQAEEARHTRIVVVIMTAAATRLLASMAELETSRCPGINAGAVLRPAREALL